MTRVVPLSALRAGIERMRTKGGAKPDALYDLVNGYVTIDGGARSRPGTAHVVTLPSGTKGLCAFNGALYVFSHEAQTIGASTPEVRCEQVIHPETPSLAIERIHFAEPFMGSLYVVAEFSNGDVRHFWLRDADTWAAGTAYELGDLVQPSVPNGYLYRARRLHPAGVTWAASVPRAIGDVVEPTVSNGYEYECIDTLGTNPRSGTTEPAWPTSEGAIVVEDTSRTPPPASTPGPTTPPGDNLDPGTGTRYERPAGRRQYV